MSAPQNNYDVIVIGSGLGGLTAGTLLQEAGRKVLILERHTVAGGLTHTFSRKGFSWDVGVHYVGQMHDARGILRRVFDRITDGKLKWESMGRVYDRAIIEGVAHDYVAGTEAQIAEWSRKFPGEETAIRAYVKLVKETSAASAWYFGERTMPQPISRIFGKYLRRKFETAAARTTDEVLREITPNEQLRAVLSAQCGNYGLHPTESSFGIHAIIVDHYLDGGSYPVGGAGNLYKAISVKFLRLGGAIRLRAEVAEVLRENGRAVGVRLVNGEVVRAKAIVSNAGAANTYGKLLRNAGDGAGRTIGNVSDSISAAEMNSSPFLNDGIAPSTAHVCLYVGLNASDSELNLPRHNTWIYEPGFFAGKFRSRSGTNTDGAPVFADPLRGDGITYISYPSAKDPEWASHSPNRSTIQVIAPCAYETLSEWKDTRFGKRGEAYYEWKRKVTDRLLGILIEQHPQLKSRIAHVELSTPLSTRHFSAHPRGEIYGLDHRPARFAPAFARKFLRPETEIPGLFLTGQDIVTVGVGGALYSGVLAATKVLNKSVILRILTGWKL